MQHLLFGWASLAVAYQGAAYPARSSVLPRSSSLTMRAVNTLGGLEEFDEQMGSADVMAVKFVAERCRGCMALKPKFDALAKSKASKASFFEISYKTARDLFEREGVKRTPTVLYFCGGVGRVGGFAFGPKVDRDLVHTELEQVLRHADRLRELSPSALRPALRYKALVGMLRALAGAESLLEDEARARGTTLAERLKSGALAKIRRDAYFAAAATRAAAQPERAADAAALFAWLDPEGSGCLTAADLTAVVDALGGDEAFTGRIGAGGGSGLPTEPSDLGPLLEAAVAVAANYGEICREAFVDLLMLHRMHEQATLKPEAEARAAYALLDSKGSGGAVPFDVASERIASMCAHLALDEGATLDGECKPAAIQRMLEAFDYEERGHLSFDCFARVVMRSAPSPWGATTDAPAVAIAAAVSEEGVVEAAAPLPNDSTLTVGQCRERVSEWLVTNCADDPEVLRQLAKSEDDATDAGSLATSVAHAIFPDEEQEA